MENPKLKPALIGGVSFGIAAALPYIGLLNGLCCALFIGSGVLAAYQYMKDRPPTAKAPYGDGAVVGLLAGLVGGVTATVVGALVAAAGFGADQMAEGLAQLQQAGIPLPEWLASPEMNAEKFFLNLGINVAFNAIFATVGGLVGIAIFHKKDAA